MIKFLFTNAFGSPSHLLHSIFSFRFTVFGLTVFRFTVFGFTVFMPIMNTVKYSFSFGYLIPFVFSGQNDKRGGFIM